MVDDFGSLWRRTVSSHPVPSHQASVRTVLSRPEKREDAPFDNEDVVTRLPASLHKLCARMLEHLLRLRLVVGGVGKGGRGGPRGRHGGGGVTMVAGWESGAPCCGASVWLPCAHLLLRGRADPRSELHVVVDMGTVLTWPGDVQAEKYIGRPQHLGQREGGAQKVCERRVHDR